MKQYYKITRETIKIVCIIFAVPFIYSFINITCPSRIFFHLSCPFCGMTRAWLSALQFDFAKAYQYHPLFWLFPIFLVLLIPLLEGYKHKKLLILELVISIVFLIVYIIRLLFFEIY